jgi:hypothetical protein
MSAHNPLGALNADWMEVHSVTSFIEKVDPNFEWKGPGWYPKTNGRDTVYISPPFAVGHSPENHYGFYIYNDHDPRGMARVEFRRVMGDVPCINPHTDGLWEGASEDGDEKLCYCGHLDEPHTPMAGCV